MTDLRKAAEMALTALDALYVNDYSGYEISKHESHVVDEAIEALRQALSQPEQECIYPECETGIGCDGPCGEKPVDETAKHRHEVVAWHEPGAYGNVTTHKDWALANGWEPLYKEKKT